MTRFFLSSLSFLFVLGFARLCLGSKFVFKKRDMRNPRSAHSHIIASTGNRLGSVRTANTGDRKVDDDTEIGNIDNIRYTTTVTVNGKEIPVALDTGSTDLWIMPPGGLGRFEDTGISLNLKYGDGSYGVQGTIGLAPFEFGPYTIEKQAFLYASKSTINGLTDIGLEGLFGLGLDTHGASPIKMKIASVRGKNQTWGASVLENIFNQHPTQPNFVGFDLVRTEDMEDNKDGSFTIGEYDEDYTAIEHLPKLPQFPPKADRWTLLVDGISVNGKSVPLSSSVHKAPKGKSVALLDTGAPNTIFPVSVLDGVFSKFSGAVKFAQEGAQVVWIVPCNAIDLVEFNFSGVKVPIHPLDMSIVYKNVNVLGQNYTYCLSSPSGQDGYAKDFDILLGDDFLRNVYSVYDFGDDLLDGTTDEPYMRLLPKTNVDNATDQFHSIRDRLFSPRYQQLPPSEMLDLLSRQVRLQGGRMVSIDSKEKNSVETYARVIIGLLSASLFIGIVLIILGVAAYVRKRNTARSVATTYTPIKVTNEEESQEYGNRYSALIL